MIAVERHDDPFFRFGPFDDEIARKLDSLARNPADLADRLVRELRTLGCPVPELCRVQALLDCLAQLDFDRMYPNYLTHPIRVAASVVRVRRRVEYDDVALALCHNIREAGFADLDGAVDEHLTPTLVAAVDLLTIDRTREREPAYVAVYYDRIERAPEPLMMLKSLDKLDNALWGSCFDVDVWEMRVLEDQVCPRVAARYPAVAAYLRALSTHVVDPDTRRRFAARCGS